MTLGFYLYNEVLYWPLNLSQKPPEAVSEIVNYKIFLGEHAPRPPPPPMLACLHTPLLHTSINN